VYICYVDEAGEFSTLPSATSPVQPVVAVTGVVIAQDQLRSLTRGLLRLKQRFYPGAVRPSLSTLNWMLVEVKGSTLRADVRSGSRRKRTHAYGFLDGAIRLLQSHGAFLISRIWVKGIAEPTNHVAAYTFSIQALCANFDAFLRSRTAHGVVIADSRSPAENTQVSYSIFTQKFRRQGGDPHPSILEMPTFGHSTNHAGLQLADWICSGILFPMATAAYCAGTIESVHVHPDFAGLRDRYSPAIKALQYRYTEGGRTHGGIVVSDSLSQRPSSALFAHPPKPGI